MNREIISGFGSTCCPRNRETTGRIQFPRYFETRLGMATSSMNRLSFGRRKREPVIVRAGAASRGRPS
jgi:hypothetical protein